MNSPLRDGFSSHRWIPLTNDQWCGDYGLLVPKTTHRQYNSYPGQLLPKTTPTQDNSYPRQFERVVLGTSLHGYELSKYRSFVLPLALSLGKQLCGKCIQTPCNVTLIRCCDFKVSGVYQINIVLVGVGHVSFFIKGKVIASYLFLQQYVSC